MDLQNIGPSGESLDAINTIKSDLHYNRLVTTLRDSAFGESRVSFNSLKRLPYSMSDLSDPDYISSVMKNFGNLVKLAQHCREEYLREIILPLGLLLHEMQSSYIVGIWPGQL
jgi:hypothetical protein